MPQFLLNVEMVDSMGRKARKSFVSSPDVADFDAATTAAAGLVADLAALSELRILAYTLGQRTVYADTFDAGANKDEGLTLVVEKTDNYRAVLAVPGPIQAVRNSDGTADVSNAAVAAYIANFIDGADLWTLSDGEFITGVLSGRIDT